MHGPGQLGPNLLDRVAEIGGVTESADGARDLERARYVLWKNPENLTDRQAAKLAWIEKTHPYLYRAWLLKEGIRVVFQLKGQPATAADSLDRWLKWAARSRIPQFVELGKTIRQHRRRGASDKMHQFSGVIPGH
jgi:transposase